MDKERLISLLNTEIVNAEENIKEAMTVNNREFFLGKQAALQYVLVLLELQGVEE